MRGGGAEPSTFAAEDFIMWYISFRGEEGGGSAENIYVYHDSGQPHSDPTLLPTGGSVPPLQELRGFQVVGDLLYVVNAYKDYSQILTFQEGSGGYAFDQIYASMQTVNSILHPFDLTFDTQGNCYLSSQDTNVVTGLAGANAPMPISPYLLQHYTQSFYAGTMVASAIGSLPGCPAPAPPDVPAPQGLDVSYTDGTDTKVANSVRGVVWYQGYLYVADEPGNAVKAYDTATGQLAGVIAGSNLSSPVHLLLNAGTLYIGSTGNDSVVTYSLAGGPPSGTVAPVTFIEGKLSHVSGLAFGGDGNFYAAERKAQKIKRFKPDGSDDGTFIENLPDDPEFILYVPKD